MAQQDPRPLTHSVAIRYAGTEDRAFDQTSAGD
jgi:hypothetical protein